VSSPLEGAIAMRRRSVWEAADSGLLLWRENIVYFLPFFAFPFWICAFVLRLLPFPAWPLPWIILWYLKPFFNRMVLHVISVRFFEPRAGALRIFRGFGKTIFRSVPGDLLWRRFSPWRAVMTPVRVLEGSKARRIRQRKKNLVKGGIDFCVVLSLWGFVLEWFLLGGEILFTIVIVELVRPDLLDSLEVFLRQKEIYIFAAWCFNLMLVESMYVCMGFGLYINSRVEIEGWDLEIAFRKLAEKARPVSAPVVFVCIFFLLFPLRGGAEDLSRDSFPLESLEEIFESKDFGGEKDSWGIRWKNKTENETAAISVAPWVKNIKQIFGFVLRLVLVAAITALVVLMFFYMRRNYLPGRVKKKKYRGLAASFSVESAEALFEKALAFRRKGCIREAWAACLAGTLSAFSEYRGLEFPGDATEYDCLSLVKKSGLDAAPFAGLVENWIGLAYAGKDPAEGAFERAVGFGRSIALDADGTEGA
jgi:hypothetical protein